MSYKLSKLITLAGGAVGGISVSSSMLFGPKEESTLYKTTSSNIDDKELKSEPTSTEREQSRATTVVTKKCFIFVTDAAVGQREDMKITKILRKCEDFEKFLAEITGNESFKKDVKDACEGKKSGINKNGETFNVYVYQKTDSSKAWNYTLYLQKKDWINEDDILKGFTAS